MVELLAKVFLGGGTEEAEAVFIALAVFDEYLVAGKFEVAYAEAEEFWFAEPRGVKEEKHTTVFFIIKGVE